MMTYRTAMLAGAAFGVLAPLALAQQATEPGADDVATEQTEQPEETTARDATLLRRLVVSAGAEKVAIETPQAVTVVDQEDLNAEQPTTIGDALRDLPGVSTVGSDRILGESFNIRGFGTATSSDETRIIVQVDGATKFHEQYRLGSLFTDPELYKNVEVLRGPASSTLYGSGALAGVIRLETKDPSDILLPGDPFAWRQKFEFSSNGEGFLTSSIAAWAPTERAQFLAAFNYRQAQELKDGSGERLASTDFEAPSALVKGVFALDPAGEHTLEASFQYWNTDDSGQQLTQTETSPFFGTIDREVTDTTAVLKYAFLPTGNDLIDFSAQISYSESDVEQENASLEGAFGGSTLFQDVNYANQFIETRVENTSTFEGDNWENYLTVGLQTQFRDRVADAVSEGFPPGGVPPGELEGIRFHPDGETQQIGIYAQSEFIWNEKLTLIPGIRIDWRELEAGDLVPDTVLQDQSDTAVSPKLAAFYQVNDTFGLFGSYAYTERLPVIDEVFNGAGNPGLEPETANTYEAGFTLAFDDIFSEGDGAAFKGTYFFNDVEDLIEQFGQGQFSRNAGSSEIQGFELEGSYNSEFTFARLALNVIEGNAIGEMGAADEPLASIPADEIVLTLGGRVPSQGLEGGVRILAAAEQDDRPLDFFGNAQDPIPGYVVLDLFSSWRPQDGPLAGTDFRLGVENLFDHNYIEALSANLVGDRAKGQTFKFTVARTF